MKITEVAIGKLKPYEKNAKKHPASQVKAIARSIEAFGFNVPLVIDAKHRIWSGHGRLEAAKILNHKTLPCVMREDLTDEQLKAYSLADNKLNESDYLDVWYQKRDNTAKYIHPTQKPVQLAERALKRSSAKGDIVLDAFGGSFSTMIACEQLKRKFRGVELDPKYVDAGISRWCQYMKTDDVVRNGKKIRWESHANEKAKKI